MLYLYLDLKEPSKVYVFYALKAIVKDQSRPSYTVIYRLIFYAQIVARFSECYNRVCATLIILLSILPSSSQEEFCSNCNLKPMTYKISLKGNLSCEQLRRYRNHNTCQYVRRIGSNPNDFLNLNRRTQMVYYTLSRGILLYSS